MKASQRNASSGGGSVVKVVVIVLVVVVVGAAAWWFLLRATPEKALAKYVAAAKAGNEQAAKACLTTETAKAVDEMQQSMGALGPMAGNVKLATSLIVPPMFDMDVKIGKAEVKGDTATVPVTLQPKQGAKGAAGPKGGAPGSMGGAGPMGGQARPIRMKLEGGQWKIDLAQEMAMAKQMMAYFTGGGGGGGFQQMAQQMGEQMAQKMGAPPPGGQAPAPGATPPAGAPTKAGGGAADLVAAGMADKTAGRMDAAAAKFQAALKIDANNSDAHWGMAWVLAAQGKKPEARAEFEKVAKLSTDPKRTDEARQALARLK